MNAHTPIARALSIQRSALLRVIASYGPTGVITAVLNRKLPGQSVKSNARKAERAGLVTRDRDARCSRWFISDLGKKAIEHPSAGPELLAARARIRDLESEVLRLNDVIRGGVTGAPPSWGLSPSEERLVSALASVFPRVLSVDGILSRAWPDTYPTTKIVDVTVCKARKKLARHGVEIRSLWGRGYSLCENGAAAVRAIGRD